MVYMGNIELLGFYCINGMGSINGVAFHAGDFVFRNSLIITLLNIDVLETFILFVLSELNISKLIRLK